MTINFNVADATLTTSRVLLYTCPGSTQAVVFEGTISNVDDSNLVDHSVTLEVQKTDNSYVKKLNKVPVPYGSSLALPKVTLLAGEKVYLTAEATNVLIARLSIVERT